MLHFEDITGSNWRIPLAVTQQQKKYVSDPMRLLARAYAYRNQGSYACMICNDSEPVGMALYYELPDENAYDFSQLFIDARYQGKGYGKEAAKALIDRMRIAHKYDKVILCYIAGNDTARRMYERLGFTHTGEVDGDEITMELHF